jgi:tetratricopeptide (TPR) repeat protein
MKDFFISYNKADKAWAEWVAWILEEAGYSVIIQAWDFRPGENFVLRMQEAARESKQTIAIISQAYLDAMYTYPEWAAAFAQDPRGENRTLIPIKVNPCEPSGLLKQIINIDLVGLSEAEAKRTILESLKERAKPNTAPRFPTSESASDKANREVKEPVRYPGGTYQQKAEIPSNLPAGISLFVGREEILNQLRQALGTGDSAQGRMQAITGLGGIGKTQTAIEFARRFRDDYTALLWAVAESAESLRSDFVAIAGILNLPEAQLQDQPSTLNAVKRWFTTNEGWLLILDNADDVSLLTEFIPPGFKGSILLTSRAQVFDSLRILNAIELESLTPEEAKDFLVRRTGLTDLDKNESDAAEELAKELDYLPLALEQAAAYIRQLKGSFPDYLNSYSKRGLELLEKGQASGEYRKSVRTTWSLNFQQVAAASTSSADFLRISAFLNPDRIPTEFFAEAAKELGPDIASSLRDVETDPLLLDELMQPSVNFSLIHRDRKTRTYNIHRLVQVVVLGTMDEPTKLIWCDRVIKALESVFLDVDEVSAREWARIERLVFHVQRVSDVVAQSLPLLSNSEAVRLFNRAGRYLHLRGRLLESGNLYDEALRIAGALSGGETLDLATSLQNKAWLLIDLGKYQDAEPLVMNALRIRKALLEPQHSDVARSLYWVGVVHEKRGRYREALQSIQQSLVISERNKDDERSVDVAERLQFLAGLYYELDENEEAEESINRSMKILGPQADVAPHILAGALHRIGTMKAGHESETVLKESIVSYETSLGSDYPRLAYPLTTLGRVYAEKGKYDEAEALLYRSLKIREEALGPNHPEVVHSLRALCYLRRKEKRIPEAEAFAQRALAIAEESLGQDSPVVADSLISLIHVYLDQNRAWKAEPLARRAVAIRKKVYGIQSKPTASTLMLYSQTLSAMNRKGEAQRLADQARRIQETRKKKKR